MKISLNLVKLHIKYCRLFFSAKYVAQNRRTIGVLAMSFLAMSVLVTWSRDVMSRVFSAPAGTLISGDIRFVRIFGRVL